MALIGPWYEDGKILSGYKPLDINGTYDILHKKEMYKSDSHEIMGAPCDRSWMNN